MVAKEKVQIDVRVAQQSDRSQLAYLIHFEPRVHRHLDWRPPLDWLGTEPYYVAEKKGRVFAALACPPDPPGVAWIRLFVSATRMEVTESWQILWAQAREHLRTLDGVAAMAIPLQRWFRKLLEQSDFRYIHNVQVLVWDSNKTDLPAHRTDINLRKMKEEDLAAVQRVDAAAFGPMWRNSLETLQLAYLQAVYASVAEDQQGRMIGYQISTPSPAGAHLARLAVHPDVQQGGIGFALVRDVQKLFEGQFGSRVSVNTQDDNAASLALYAKAGFYSTGEVYPVYQYSFTE